MPLQAVRDDRNSKRRAISRIGRCSAHRRAIRLMTVAIRFVPTTRRHATSKSCVTTSIVLTNFFEADRLLCRCRTPKLIVSIITDPRAVDRILRPLARGYLDAAISMSAGWGCCCRNSAIPRYIPLMQQSKSMIGVISPNPIPTRKKLGIHMIPVTSSIQPRPREYARVLNTAHPAKRQVHANA
jgi:hypothetical protein